MKLFKVLCQCGISQVTRWGTAQGAELIVRRLKTRVEEGGVKVVSVRKDDTHTNNIHTNTNICNTINLQESTTDANSVCQTDFIHQSALIVQPRFRKAS